MIKIKKLWKSYGKAHVLKGLDLEIQQGETLVIMGKSGAGKSVLLKQILGIEKPDQGSIEIDGTCISNLSDKELFQAIKHVGMLFQGAALFDSMTVGDNTAFYLTQHKDPKTNKKLTKNEIKQRVLDSLSSVGLEGTENKMPSDLSGGMKKRAGLARLIAYQPKILLYDEPTTGLDPITSNQINQLILNTQKKLCATSIVVTHDVQSAFTIANRLAFHHEGVISHIAPKKEFMQIQDPTVKDFLKYALK